MTQKTVKLDDTAKRQILMAWFGERMFRAHYYDELFNRHDCKRLFDVIETEIVSQLATQIAEPVFDVGKRYRSQSGDIWMLGQKWDQLSSESGNYAFAGSNGRRTTSFTADGKYYAGKMASEDDLIPGAIEESAPIAERAADNCLGGAAGESPAPVPYDQHEREILAVIDQRDAAEEALSEAYRIVTGDTPEWSNGFGHKEALAEIEERAVFQFPRIPESPAPGLSDEAPDMVNHPPHYTSRPSGVECITITEHMGFNLGNALKYIWRADMKNGVEDLQKAGWYIQREIAKRGVRL